MAEQRIEFLVQGSAPEPYRVTFVRPGVGEIYAFCTCPAGENGQYCKHRFRLLTGSTRGVVSQNVDAAELIPSWLSGTELEAEIERMRDCEKAMSELKRELSQRKVRVAQVMRGQS